MTDIQVLLIDNDAKARETLADYLRTVAEFEVVEDDHGIAALEDLKANWQNYTAVLLDYVLEPTMPGEKLIEVIRQQYPQLPVIVFTGRDPVRGIQTLERGVYAYMRRPLDFVEMANLIHDLAEQEMVFSRMARDVKDILGSDICLAWRLNRKEHQFRVVGWAGKLDREYRQNVKLDSKDEQLQKIFAAENPIYLSNVQDPRKAPFYRHREAAVERKWTSLISIPVVHKRRIIGLLDSYTYSPFLFKDKNERVRTMRLLYAFANQAVEAVRYANLAQRAQALQEINQTLAETLAEETIIRQILYKASELVGADFGWLYMFDTAIGKLRLRESHGVAREKLDDQRELGEGITGWVAGNGTAYYAPLVTDEVEEPRHKLIADLEVKSEIAVPLRRGEQTIGALTVSSRFQDAFTDDDLNLLISLAAQATVAMQRAKLTRHLQQVSRLALEQEFQELAEYVVEAVKDLTGADVNLWMMSEKEGEQGQFMRSVAGRGNFSENFAQATRLPVTPGSSITAHALEQKRPIFRRDILNDLGEPKFYVTEESRKQEWRSFMAVPLLGREGEYLGGLNLYSQAVAKFGQPEADLMQTFANQAAIALQQQKRTSSLQQLSQVSEKLTESMTNHPRLLLGQVANVVRELTKADCTVIYPYDPVKKGFYQKEGIAAVGIQHSLSAVRDKPRKDGLAALVRSVGFIIVHDIDRGHIEFGLDASKKPNADDGKIIQIIRDARFVQREGIKAFVGVSLRANERGDTSGIEAQEVGTLYVNFRRPHRFTREELQIIRIYAYQVANVIRSARLYAEAQRHANELQAVHQTALKIVAQQEDVHSLLQSLVSEATDLLQGKGGIVYLRVHERNELELVAVCGIAPEILKSGFKMPFGTGMAGRIIQSRQPMIRDDYSTWSGRDKRLESLFSAVIEVPLLRGEEAIGVIGVFDDADKRKFTSDDTPILERLAQQAALAIHNASILAESQNRLKLLDALHDTSLDIVRRLDFEKLMPAIIKRAKNLMAVESLKGIGAGYWRCDHESGKAILEYSTNQSWQGIEISLNESLIGKVVRERQAAIQNDFPHWEHHATIFDREDWVQSIQNLIEVPIKKEDKVIAILAITDASGQRLFDDNDIALLRRFADMAAIAIQNAELVKQERTLRHQAETLSEVSSVISSNLAIADVTSRILDELGKVIGFRKATVQLIQGDSRTLIAYRGFGQEAIDESLLGPISKDDLINRIIVGKEPLILSDPQQDSDWKPGKWTTDVKSWVGVPLVYGEEPIGLLTLDHEELGFYKLADKGLLDLFANQAAIAIQNARLFEKIQAQREAQIKAVREIADSIAAQLELDRVLDSILSWSVALIGEASLGEVRLLDKNTSELVVRASRGKVINEHYRRLPIGRGITGYAAQEKKTLYVPDVRKDGRYLPGLAGTLSELAVPMIRDDELIGILNIEHPQVNAFTEEDIKLGEAIAGLAVVAIQNNRLFKELKDRANRLEHLQKVTTTISAESSDLEKVLRLIVNSLSAIFHQAPCVIRLYDSGSGQFTHRVAAIANVLKEKVDYTPRTKGIGQYVISTRKAYYVEDTLSSSSYEQPTVRKAIIEQGVRAIAALPLLSDEDLIGILYLNLTTPHQFSQADKQIMKLFASQAAVAINNVKLYKRIQEQREEEIKAFQKIGKTIYIAAPKGRDEVLTSIIDSMVSLMGRSKLFVVRLLDKETNELVVTVLRGKTKEGFLERTPVGRGITGWVAQYKIVQYVPDILNDSRYLPGLEGARSELAVPMLKGNELIGVLNIEHPQVNAFTESDIELAQAIASLAVVAIDNAELYADMERRVTERTLAWREAQERATAAEKLATIGAIGAEFVHRMNNLAGTIPVRINLAKENLDVNPENNKVLEQLNRIEIDAHRLLQAAQEIKLSTETQAPEIVSVNEMIEKALERVWFSHPRIENGIEIRKNYGNNLPVIFVERNTLLETLCNLIKNGVEAMPGGGILTVSTSLLSKEGKPFIEIAVSDTGYGISSANLSKIFDLFFTTKERGLGFGLWRDKTFIKGLGGDIEVHSKEGEGTKFVIQVPANPE